MPDIRTSALGGIPFGNSANRPTGATGQPYFNGEEKRLEIYTSSGWQNIVSETPGVVSVSGNYLESTGSGSFEITGTNFTTGAIASVVGTNGVEVQASSTTVNSIVSVTAVFTGLSNANEPYDLKITNTSNLFGLLPDAIYINASPVWQTASGSLGIFQDQVAVSISATATDETAITYSLASGSTLPSGITLNSASGLISGTLPDVTSNTTYTFTVNASDVANPVIPRTFSITQNAAPVWNTSSGLLGSFWNNTNISTPALSVTDTDSVTYALASGSSLPSGLTLNSSTGVISGLLPSVGTDTTYNFNINTTDGINTVVRSFSINSAASISIDYLLAAGGGGGGQDVGGGGGAGGLLIGTTSVSRSSYAISVGDRGAGGTANGGSAPNGGNTSAFSLTAIGGGGGGNYASGNGASGGSGGGGSGYTNPGSSSSGTSGQGFAGGARGGVTAANALVGAGGGGAGGVGGTMSLSSPVLGGAGVVSSITGSSETYCEGGRAFSDGAQGMRIPSSTQFGFGGDGAGTGATALGESTNESGTRGGPGVVIIAYSNTKPAITTIPGTLTYDQPTRAGYRVYRFTAGSGTITF